MDENRMQMRSVLIYGEKEVKLMERLSNVPGWELGPLGIPGGHMWCLSKGGEQIALREIAPNVVSTSNVIPHDWERDQAKANELLTQLSNALTEAGIANVIAASEHDIA